MSWEKIIKKDDLLEFNSAVNKAYEIINEYHQLGELDYEEHLMKFTAVVDAIVKKLERVA